MKNALPVIAGVPNFNHGDALRSLIPALLEQEYDGVVICDDASTVPAEIDALHDVVRTHRGSVELVAGDKNVGAGANRNRVLVSSTLERVGGLATIHYVDADAVINSDRSPERVRKAIEQPRIGAVGGLVLDESGVQSLWNYGPTLDSPARFVYASATGGLLRVVEGLRQKSPEKAERWQQRLDCLLHEWPNTFEAPTARDVGWLIEANMAVNSNVLTNIGGFDPSIRFHSTQEFSAQLRRLGLRRHFEPSISITRRNIDVRGPARSVETRRATIRLLARYTLHTRPRYNRMHG